MCKFCNNSGDHRYTTSSDEDKERYFLNLFGNSYLRIGIENKVYGLDFKKYPKIQSIKIKFCPFCGRSLS